MRILSWQVGAALLLVASTASAQTPIDGVDLLTNQAYSTISTGFVANYGALVPSAGMPGDPYMVDWDATLTSFWVIDGFTWQYGTVDILGGTGNFTAVGIATGFPTDGSELGTGITADANGTDWYAMTVNLTTFASVLYTTNNIAGGAWTLVGTLSSGTGHIDVAIDSVGNCYAHSIVDDALYSVDETTAISAFIGACGYNFNWAQGMDVDWSTNTLYATAYNINSTSDWASIDTTTGLLTSLEVTTTLGIEAEMGCRALPAEDPGVPACFGDQGSALQCGCFNFNLWPGAPTPNGGCLHDQDDVAGPGGWGDLGGHLYGSGIASVGNDTLKLHLDRGPRNNFSLFFQGKDQIQIEPFWEGILCTAQDIIRLELVLCNNDGYGETSVGIWQTSASNIPPDVIAPGELRRYQVWFRTPNTVCPNNPQKFSNTSNALDVIWGQ
jgi:hypothetical protein